MTRTQIQELVESALLEPPKVATAHTFIGRSIKDSELRPCLVDCSDNNEYWIKSIVLTVPHCGRMLVTDQVVGRIGRTLGCSVAETRLIELPSELVTNEPQMSHLKPGICHAVKNIKGCSDGVGVDHIELPANRKRFALLAVLYGLCHAQDHQFLYSNVSPHYVHSVDHGLFLPGGRNWTHKTLRTDKPAVADERICSQCVLTSVEIASAASALYVLTPSEIALAVASPPEAWAFPLVDRVDLAEYLLERRNQLIERYV